VPGSPLTISHGVVDDKVAVAPNANAAAREPFDRLIARNASWALRLVIAGVNVAPAPCLASFQGLATPFDAAPTIAKYVEQWLRSELASALPELERRSSFKSRAEPFWAAASAPIPLSQDPPLLATPNPLGAALTSISITDTSAAGNLAVAFSRQGP
jgi:hypothetical protein